MKRFLLVFFLLFSTVKIFAQQFSQLNTGTLFDSFENPAQNSFIADTSRKYAFNLFAPNFNTNVFVTGNGQTTLKDRAFNYKYRTDNLMIGQGRFNRINANVNAYSVLYKVFSDIEDNTEMGISLQSKVEIRGLMSDESLALFNGYANFPNEHYDNVFNNNATVQAYHQFSFIYRQNVNKKIAFGIKLSALLGVEYQKLNIVESHINFDKFNGVANLNLRGQYQLNHIPGGLAGRDILPTFTNPGAAITVGTMFHLDNGYTLQANMKDLGFIHWNNQSYIYNFNAVQDITGINTKKREDNIFGAVKRIIHDNGTETGFNTNTDAKFEVSVNKSFWIDSESRFKYSPTLVASKDVFFDSYVGALVNPIQYGNYVFTFTAAYNNYKMINFGTQFMIKATDVEFYIGSDRLLQTIKLATADHKSDAYINSTPTYTGADIFLGFSLKFGPVLEHPMNSSSVATSQRKSFFKRFINRLTKSED
ncbi:hypothetical protein FFF34_007410 [Inquilinus sp. KBS0705]|nr:hypothetical protein FFF34_007410 [Inquilinus sp. KBS0705]